MPKREIDLFIIFEIHPVTCRCHAKELVSYFKSIKPKRSLKDYIIDIWQFSKQAIDLVTLNFWYIRFTTIGNVS